MDAGVFIQYIIRKAVIVSRPSVVTPNSSAASLKRAGELRRHSVLMILLLPYSTEFA
jgi:hypothetical protein